MSWLLSGVIPNYLELSRAILGFGEMVETRFRVNLTDDKIREC